MWATKMVGQVINSINIISRHLQLRGNGEATRLCYDIRAKLLKLSKLIAKEEERQ
jgi:hypothetical protein